MDGSEMRGLVDHNHAQACQLEQGKKECRLRALIWLRAKPRRGRKHGLEGNGLEFVGKPAQLIPPDQAKVRTQLMISAV